MRLSFFLPVTAMLLASALGCPPDDPCECDDDPFEFEVDGSGNDTRVYDVDGMLLDEIVVDARDCSCAKRVRLELSHRDGLKLDPPETDACIIDASKGRSTQIFMVFKLGDACRLDDWAPLDTQPPFPLPIKIRP